MLPTLEVWTLFAIRTLHVIADIQHIVCIYSETTAVFSEMPPNPLARNFTCTEHHNLGVSQPWRHV